MSLLGHNYQVFLGGTLYAVDGTSASAPVMAAFISLVNSRRKASGLSTMGWINPFLYQYHSNFTNDITSGDNKCSSLFTTRLGRYNHTCCREGFYATNGWDPVTGLGSVNFNKFLLTAMSVTGINEASFPPASADVSSQNDLAFIITIVIIVVVLLAVIAGTIYVIIILIRCNRQSNYYGRTVNPSASAASEIEIVGDVGE